MIEVTSSIALKEDELEFRAVRASGPGGQHVNKVSTAIQLRFRVRGSPSLPETVAEKLEKLAGARLTLEGEIIINADGYRSQERNKADALERLCDLIRQAATPVKKRRPTRPTLASKQRRLSAKANRGAIKAGRGRPVDRD